MPQTLFSQPLEEWVQRYNGPGNSFDIVSKLLIDNIGNVYVYGSSGGNGTLTDMTIVKYSSSGNIIWVSRYNGNGNSVDQISSAYLDNSANSYITGFTTDSTFSSNITTIKVDSSGNINRVNIYHRAGYTAGFGQDIILDDEDNIVVTGFMRNSGGTYDIALIKYSNSMNEIWSITYDGEGHGDDIPVSLMRGVNNNIIVAGSSASLLNGLDMIVLKYNSSSNLIWQRKFNGKANADDRITAIDLDNENNILLTGSIYNNTGSSDYFFAKLNTDGQIQWNGSYNGKGNSFDIPSSIDTDNNKNIYITGYSRNGAVSGTEDILTLKISPFGNIIWSKTFNGIADGTDQGNTVKADDSGNVYIGGASDRGNVQLTYALLKYNPVGDLEWFKNYSLAGIPEDFIYDLKLDKYQNIYVTGISLDTINDYDITTIKYSQTVRINNNSTEAADNFILHQNYPNPFNPKTRISYEVRNSGYISFVVLDVLGNELMELVNQKQRAGIYNIELDLKDLPSGIYFYRIAVHSDKLSAGKLSDTKKMVLIK